MTRRLKDGPSQLRSGGVEGVGGHGKPGLTCHPFVFRGVAQQVRHGFDPRRELQRQDAARLPVPHELAGYGEWGQLMQHDVTDGVKHLIANGTVDPGRVCIIGASYGGYSALAGAAFTPDLYSCAVSVNGVSDLVEMLYWVENRGGYYDPAVRFWRKHIGKSSDPEVAQYSPARAAGKVSARVMLMHGVDDTVVPYAQSEFMETALRRERKNFELVKLKSEDHWLSRSPSRIEMLTSLERFLDANIGKGGKVTIEEGPAQAAVTQR